MTDGCTSRGTTLPLDNEQNESTSTTVHDWLPIKVTYDQFSW